MLVKTSKIHKKRKLNGVFKLFKNYDKAKFDKYGQTKFKTL